MSEQEKVFAEGIYFDKPREGAPDFIKGRISLKREALLPFVEKHTNEKGYINLDLKKSQGGKLYLELNDWKPEQKEEATPPSPFDDSF